MSVRDLDTGHKNRQLHGWKEIAAALGKDESTVKRWAATRGLPVHRAPGTKRASVYAWTHQISEWLTSQSRATNPRDNQVPEAPPVSSSSSLHVRQVPTALLAAIILMGMAAAAFPWLRPAAPNEHSRYRPSDAVQNMFSDGIYLYRRRSPESLELAAKNFERAIRIDPGFAQAHAALAVTYDLMVEYGSLDADEGYAAARRSAQAALALDPRSADALAVMGDLTFFQDKRYEEALDYFRRAVDAEPENALTRQWYSSALQSLGRYNEALLEINEAQRLDPGARSILVSKAMVLMAQGDVSSGQTILQQLVAHEPGYRSPYRFLSFAALKRGDDLAYLAALRERFRLTKDIAGLQIVNAGAVGYEQGGRAAMSKAMASRARQVSATAEPYFLAHVFALASEPDAAASHLEAVKTRHAFYHVFDPAFEAARLDVSFQDRMRKIGLPIVP